MEMCDFDLICLAFNTRICLCIG